MQRVSLHGPSVHSPQVQVEVHVRVGLWDPQLPQDRGAPVSVVPATHTPLAHAVHSDHAPHVQLLSQVRVRVRCELAPAPHGQFSRSVSIAPGVQGSVGIAHVPQSDHAPQPHVALQVRVRVWVPHEPQGCVSSSSRPAGHTAVSPMHALHSDHSPHAHSALQVRERV